MATITENGPFTLLFLKVWDPKHSTVAFSCEVISEDSRLKDSLLALLLDGKKKKKIIIIIITIII